MRERFVNIEPLKMENEPKESVANQLIGLKAKRRIHTKDSDYAPKIE